MSQEVVRASEGVPLIAYSAALARFPLPHLFTTLFFILFFLIGLDTVFQSHETLLSVFKDASRWANGRKGQVRFSISLTVPSKMLCVNACNNSDIG